MRFAPVAGACALSLTMMLLSARNLLAHKPGQPCQTEGAASCASKSSQLLCQRSTWERGRSCARRGCAFKGDRLECE